MSLSSSNFKSLTTHEHRWLVRLFEFSYLLIVVGWVCYRIKPSSSVLFFCFVNKSRSKENEWYSNGFFFWPLCNAFEFSLHLQFEASSIHAGKHCRIATFRVLRGERKRIIGIHQPVYVPALGSLPKMIRWACLIPLHSHQCPLREKSRSYQALVDLLITFQTQQIQIMWANYSRMHWAWTTWIFTKSATSQHHGTFPRIQKVMAKECRMFFFLSHHPFLLRMDILCWPLGFGFGFLRHDSQKTLTLRELEMLRFMNNVTDKPDWFTKVFIIFLWVQWLSSY